MLSPRIMGWDTDSTVEEVGKDEDEDNNEDDDTVKNQEQEED